MNNIRDSYIDTKVYSLAIAVLDMEDYTKFKKWLIYKEYIESPSDGKYIPLDHRVKISSSGDIFVTSDLINTFYACNGINKIMLLLGIFGFLFLFINISFLSAFGEFETNVLIINIFAKLLFIHTFVQTNI